MRFGFSSRCAGRGKKKNFPPPPFLRSYVLSKIERVGQEKSVVVAT